MPPTEYAFYVGVDLGSERHQVCVLDAERRVCEKRAVEHSGPGLAALAKWLVALAPSHPGRIAVALEAPAGQRSSRTEIRLCPARFSGPFSTSSVRASIEIFSNDRTVGAVAG